MIIFFLFLIEKIDFIFIFFEKYIYITKYSYIIITYNKYGMFSRQS